MDKKFNITTYKVGFYCLSAVICIYTIYMLSIGAPKNTHYELLFGTTFLVDGIMLFINKKTNK